MSRKTNVADMSSVELVERINQLRLTKERRKVRKGIVQQIGRLILVFACMYCFNAVVKMDDFKESQFAFAYWILTIVSGLGLITSFVSLMNHESKC